jgi:hypothetical protein
MSPVKSTTPVLATIIASETPVIVAKAILRTAFVAEKYFPTPAADTRDPRILVYEAEVFDNPKAALYQDMQAAHIWANLTGIKDAKFGSLHGTNVPATRALTIVTVDTRKNEWPKDGEVKINETYICVAEGSNRFRSADGKVVHMDLNTLNCRPATEAEIQAVVTGLMTVEPVSFIKNLGDVLEGVNLQ